MNLSISKRWYILAVVALFVLFLWVYVRPVATRMYCNRVADEKARSERTDGKMDKNRYEGYYDLCTDKWGL